ncbi:MAG: Uma2 family endonuclease [Planctomycetales bacterium]|nr:Uma2 family endonuclease [Planctomycetales bacterium]
MSTVALVTAEELLEHYAHKQRCELIAGEVVVTSPAGWKHGDIGGRIQSLLAHHVKPPKLGRIFLAETGFLVGRNPDTVRAPDVAFIAKENLPATMPESAFWPGAPDLAVEVLSPDDRTVAVDKKIQTWLAAGAKLVWVVDPELETVAIYRSTTDVSIVARDGRITGRDSIAGFECDVREFFEE